MRAAASSKQDDAVSKCQPLPWHEPGVTHRSCGRCVEVKQTANIWSGRVDGRVQAELFCIHAQVGAALLHHLTQDVHLHLKTTQHHLNVFLRRVGLDSTCF